MSKIYLNISLLNDQAHEQDIRFLLIILIDKSYFQWTFKKPFEFQFQ